MIFCFVFESFFFLFVCFTRFCVFKIKYRRKKSQEKYEKEREKCSAVFKFVKHAFWFSRIYLFEHLFWRLCICNCALNHMFVNYEWFIVNYQRKEKHQQNKRLTISQLLRLEEINRRIFASTPQATEKEKSSLFIHIASWLHFCSNYSSGIVYDFIRNEEIDPFVNKIQREKKNDLS